MSQQDVILKAATIAAFKFSEPYLCRSVSDYKGRLCQMLNNVETCSILTEQ